eukprot:gene11127-18747_t
MQVHIAPASVSICRSQPLPSLAGLKKPHRASSVHASCVSPLSANVAAAWRARRATGIAPFQPQPLSRQLTKLEAAADAGGAFPSASPEKPALTNVLFSVVMACAGALAFGYHLGIVNGPLEAICQDLGILGNKSLEGMAICSDLGIFRNKSLEGMVGERGGRKCYNLGIVNRPMEAICSDLGIHGNKTLEGMVMNQGRNGVGGMVEGEVVSSTLLGAAVGSLGDGSISDWLVPRYNQRALVHYLAAGVPPGPRPPDPPEPRPPRCPLARPLSALPFPPPPLLAAGHLRGIPFVPVGCGQPWGWEHLRLDWSSQGPSTGPTWSLHWDPLSGIRRHFKPYPACRCGGSVTSSFFTGLAIGLSSALVPTYVSEVAPTAIRGTLGTINQLLICIGILVALLVNVALPVAPTAIRGTLGTVNQLVVCIGILVALLVNVALPVLQWRTMFLIGSVPALILAVGMFFCPESPRWLAANGYEASAEVAARKLWGATLCQLSGEATPAASSSKEASDSGSVGLFSGPNLKPVMIGCLLFAFQQFAGINAIVYFSTAVFKQFAGINAIVYFSTAVFKQAGVASGTLASAAVGATNILPHTSCLQAGVASGTLASAGCGRHQQSSTHILPAGWRCIQRGKKAGVASGTLASAAVGATNIPPTHILPAGWRCNREPLPVLLLALQSGTLASAAVGATNIPHTHLACRLALQSGTLASAAVGATNILPHTSCLQAGVGNREPWPAGVASGNLAVLMWAPPPPPNHSCLARCGVDIGTLQCCCGRHQHPHTHIWPPAGVAAGTVPVMLVGATNIYPHICCRLALLGNPCQAAGFGCASGTFASAACCCGRTNILHKLGGQAGVASGTLASAAVGATNILPHTSCLQAGVASGTLARAGVASGTLASAAVGATNILPHTSCLQAGVASGTLASAAVGATNILPHTSCLQAGVASGTLASAAAGVASGTLASAAVGATNILPHTSCLQAGVASGTLASAAVGATNILPHSILPAGWRCIGTLASAAAGVASGTLASAAAGVASGTLASAAVGATNILGTIIAGSIIEQTGRKTLLSNSYLGQAAAMFVMAAGFCVPALTSFSSTIAAAAMFVMAAGYCVPALKSFSSTIEAVAMFVMAAGFCVPALKSYSGIIAVAGTLVYILSFALGAGPVTGLILPELNSAKVRGRAVAAISLMFVVA